MKTEGRVATKRCDDRDKLSGQCPGEAFLLSARSGRHPIASGLRCIMDGVVLATSEELASSRGVFGE
jgi:hypothetical protein